MNSAYAQGREAALKKYAEAATGALIGGLLGAGLPTVTNSVWERPLRALGGATLGAIISRDEDTGANPALLARDTALHHFGGAVAGGVAGGLLGSLVDSKIPGPHQNKSLGHLVGVGAGAALGGAALGAVGAARHERARRERLLRKAEELVQYDESPKLEQP